MESGRLRLLTHNICTGNYSPGELVEFIDVSQKIAISYLKYQEAMGKNIRPKNAEGLNEIEDIAIDCIAGLFMRNEEGEFVQLNRYFTPILNTNNGMDNNSLLLMLRRLIVKKTKQELSRIFRERDPEGAKIIRNIRVAIRNSTQFCSFKQMGREFVSLKNKRNLRRNMIGIPERFLAQQFLEQYGPNDSVAVMMRKMLNIVHENEAYQNFLPIDAIVNLIRDVTLKQFKEQVSKTIDTTSPLHDIQIKEVDEVNRTVVKDIKRKIEFQYLNKDKIDRRKADIYFRAISDFVQDLTHERECESNFRYLKRYIPELSQESYREEERSIFEYLVKVTKKSLRKKLKDLL